MSELHFRSRAPRRRALPPDTGGASPGNWLIFAGAALALIVLAMVLSSGPDTSGGASIGEVAPAFQPSN